MWGLGKQNPEVGRGGLMPQWPDEEQNVLSHLELETSLHCSCPASRESGKQRLEGPGDREQAHGNPEDPANIKSP